MRYLSKHLEDIKDKKVLLRASLNVPIDKEGKVLDDFRIKKALPSIRKIKKYARALYIVAHIGKDATQSLESVYLELKKHIKDLQFVRKEDYFKKRLDGVFLFENLRAFKEEKNADMGFARSLASMADVFVQDAFAVLHREHASVVLLPRLLPSLAGLLVEKELRALNRALHPKGFAAFVLGGDKFSTKEPLVKKMLERYQKVLLAGALANDALLARGYSVGDSKVEDGYIDPEVLNHPHLFLPEKYTVLMKNSTRKSDGFDIKEGEIIVDAFPPLDFLYGVDFLLWNGPLGWYERGFSQGSAALINQIEIFKPKTYVGGGDSNAIIDELQKGDLFSFRSSGGGAMLKYLESETLPGLEALSR